MHTETLTGKTSRDNHIFPLRMKVDDEISIWCHLSSRKQIRSLLISKHGSCSDHCGNSPNYYYYVRIRATENIA